MSIAARITQHVGAAAIRRRRIGRTPVAAHVVRVRFDREDGRAWWTIGGGSTLARAIADARTALPAGPWQVANVEYVYGD